MQSSQRRAPISDGLRGELRLAAVLLVLLPGVAAARGGSGADGDFEERRSSHFVLHQDVAIDDRHGLRGSRRFEQDVLARLEAGYDRLDELIGLRPSRPITVVIYDPTIFDQEFGGLFGFAAAGFYQHIIRVRGDVQVSARLARTLYHELVHAAFDAVAPSVILPAWLNEGVAEWFEARALGKRGLDRREQTALVVTADQKGLFRLSDLSGPSFGRLGPEAAQLAYLQSYGFIDFLARRHGERRLRDLCREIVRTGNLPRSIRRTYREDLDRLESRYLAELLGTGR